MIARFFQSLKDQDVDYFLISGQATVLYGAAHFSEDIDLWVNPTLQNCSHFVGALRACGACHYKLTPPLTVEHLEAGHGFHYWLGPGTNEEFFLDVMGVPPRAGGFLKVKESARWIDTAWGRLPVVGLQDLVELKKTQRLEDYAIISRLALLWFEQPECRREAEDFRWGWESLFTLGAVETFVAKWPTALEHFPAHLPAALREFAAQSIAGTEASGRLEEDLFLWIQSRIARLQQADREYWRPIIAELKRFRSLGLLMPEGQPV